MEDEKYQCHICMDTARKPVVTPCGHLFCWVCIYHWLRSNQEYLTCPICKSGLEISMLRPILSPNEPPERQEDGVPPRPRIQIKRRKEKLKFDEMPGSVSALSMNLYRGVLLAGYGLFPSTISMAFQNHRKPLPNEGPLGSSLEFKIYYYLDFARFALIILAIVILFFI